MDTKDFTNDTNKNKNTKNEIFVEETVEPEVVYTKDF
jgi:hypothetical protein